MTEQHVDEEHMSNDEHAECPDDHHRCHTKMVSYGYMDCPDCNKHMPKTRTQIFQIDCNETELMDEVNAYIAMPGHAHFIVNATQDLGQAGWLIFFTVTE